MNNKCIWLNENNECIVKTDKNNTIYCYLKQNKPCVCYINYRNLDAYKPKNPEISQLDLLIQMSTNVANSHGFYIYWNKNLMIHNEMSISDALILLHSEISEAIKEYQKDDFINFCFEIADILLRTFHLIGDLNINIEKYLITKMMINKKRQYKHGKINL